jgi:hypothetical protein
MGLTEACVRCRTAEGAVDAPGGGVDAAAEAIVVADADGPRAVCAPMFALTISVNTAFTAASIAGPMLLNPLRALSSASAARGFGAFGELGELLRSPGRPRR